ncbi:MAG: hypothetical protein QW416_09270, partial [Candidatus Nitrosocaldaceae archaeon]
LYYLLMNNSSINVDTCKHRIIYDQEWVCCKCGRVFSNEEVEELQRGSMEVTAVRSMSEVGLDPHGKTPLWLQGLGSIEGYKHEKDQGSREDISIISNIADKLQLPAYMAEEFLSFYRSFVKEGEKKEEKKGKKKDKALAAKLALLLLTTEHKELALRIRRMLAFMKGEEKVSNHECYEYISTIISMQFNTTSSSKKDYEEDLPRLYLQSLKLLAGKYGIARAASLLIIIQRRRRAIWR